MSPSLVVWHLVHVEPSGTNLVILDHPLYTHVVRGFLDCFSLVDGNFRLSIHSHLHDVL